MVQMTEKQLLRALEKNRTAVDAVQSGTDGLMRDREDLVMLARGIIPLTRVAEVLGVDRRTVYDYLNRAKVREREAV